MRSFLLATTIFLILPVTAAWSADDKDDSENKTSEKTDNAADGVGSAVVEERGMDELSSYPRAENLKRELESMNLSNSDIDPTDKYRYMVKLKIDDLFWPRSKLGYSSQDKNIILIGVPRPNYRLKGNPYIRGKMDLRIGGSLFGLDGAGLLTMGYDFRSDGLIGRISSSFHFDKVSYKLTMHFDGP